MEARLLSPEVSNSGQQRRPAGALEGLPEEPARSQMIGQVRVRVTPSTAWIFATTSLPSSSSSRSPVPGTEFSCRLACGRWSDRGWHRRRPASPGKARPCSGSSDGAWPRMWERPDRPEPAAGSGSVHRMWFGPSGPCVGVGAPYLAARDRPKVCPVPAVAGSPRAGGAADGRLELPRFGLEFRQPHIGIERPAVEIFPNWLGPEVVGILGEVPPVDARCSSGGRRDRDRGS